MMSNFIHDRAKRELIKAEKQEKILSFIRDECFTESKIVAKLLDTTPTTAYRTLKKMEKEGLVKMHDVSGMDLGRQGRQAIWGLTPTGALLASDPDAEVFKIDFYEVGRVKEVTIRHSLALQLAKVIALGKGWTEWKSSRAVQQMANGERSTWIQVPDALAISPKGILCAIELERNAKTPKRYEEILSGYAQMISDETVHQVYYICPQALAPRIKRLFAQVKKIIIDGKAHEVPESLLKRFIFMSYEEWETQI